MSAGPSHLVQILLPKETGNGQPIGKDWLDGLLKELTDKFGGATSFLRAPGQVSGRAAAGRSKTASPSRKSWWKKSTVATGNSRAKGWSVSSPRMKLSSALKKLGDCDG
jgi:hypothetical protein